VGSHATRYVPGLITAYFLSRHGQPSSYARYETLQNLDLVLKLRTGPEHAGLTAVTVCSAAKRTATHYEHMDASRHRSACQPGCDASCLQPSMAVNGSARCYVIWTRAQIRCGGSPAPMMSGRQRSMAL